VIYQVEENLLKIQKKSAKVDNAISHPKALIKEIKKRMEKSKAKGKVSMKSWSQISKKGKSKKEKSKNGSGSIKKRGSKSGSTKRIKKIKKKWY